MTDIYVDASVVSMSDAQGHLAHFIDTGHQLFLVGDCPSDVVEALVGAQCVAAMPGEVTAGSWLVTDDPALCGSRVRGLQTLLVGPRVAPSPHPSPRCDAEARNIASAVLEILGREVMG
jgi:hypothetical protein